MIDNDCFSILFNGGNLFQLLGFNFKNFFHWESNFPRLAVNPSLKDVSKTDPGFGRLKHRFANLRTWHMTQRIVTLWTCGAWKGWRKTMRDSATLVFGHLPATMKKISERIACQRNRELDAKEKPVNKPKEKHHSSFAPFSCRVLKRS